MERWRGENTAVCVSEPIESVSGIAEFTFAGYPSAPPSSSVRIEITFLGSGQTEYLQLPPVLVPGEGEVWRTVRFDFPQLVPRETSG